MKIGPRKPSLSKSFKARTTGKWKRSIKRAIIPGYGKRGMGWLNPKKALYNRVYRRTTFSIFDLFKGGGSTGKRRERNTSQSSGCLVVFIMLISLVWLA